MTLALDEAAPSESAASACRRDCERARVHLAFVGGNGVFVPMDLAVVKTARKSMWLAFPWTNEQVMGLDLDETEPL